MTDNKGIFGFLKSWGGSDSEEENQRQYALSKEQDGNMVADSDEHIITSEIEFFVVEKLEKLLELSGFSGKVRIKKKYNYTLDVDIFDTGDDLGRIIGKNGYNLKAIQILLRFFIIRQFSVSLKINLDAGDYRVRQQSQIKQKVLRASRKVIKTGEEYVLEPMNAHDRRFVHTLFEKNKKIDTRSEGSGQERRVVLVRSEQFVEESQEPQYIVNE